jgi:hypothetical protein
MEALLSQKYSHVLDKNGLKTLASIGDALIANILQSASPSSDQLQDLLPSSHPHLVTEMDIVQRLLPCAQALCCPSVYKIASCGDGNCLFTSLRVALDLKYSYELSSKLLFEGKTEDDTDMAPILSGDKDGENHQENLKLRKMLVGWYCHPLSNLELEMPAEYGDAVYEEEEEEEEEKEQGQGQQGTAKKKIVAKHRRMTRMDIIIMETLYAGHAKEINMSPAPEHVQIRKRIALQYLSKMMKDRVWGSVPMIVAFAHIWKTKMPVRVYQVVDKKLVKYQDILPSGCTLPREEEDDLLNPDGIRVPQRESEKNEQEKEEDEQGDEEDDDEQGDKENQDCESNDEDEALGMDDDMQEYVPTNSMDVEMQQEQEEQEEEQEEDAVGNTNSQPVADQNFIRLLFERNGAGHYDVLVTRHQKQVISHIFPDTKKDFQLFFP